MSILNLGNNRLWKITSNNAIYQNFLGCDIGDIICLIFYENGSIIQGDGLIKLQDGKDFKGKIGDTIQLLFDGNYWFEISRSLNS